MQDAATAKTLAEILEALNGISKRLEVLERDYQERQTEEQRWRTLRWNVLTEAMKKGTLVATAVVLGSLWMYVQAKLGSVLK